MQIFLAVPVSSSQQSPLSHCFSLSLPPLPVSCVGAMSHVVEPSSYAPHGAPFQAIMPAVFSMSLFEVWLLPCLSLHACLFSQSSRHFPLSPYAMKCARVQPITHDLYWKTGVAELALGSSNPMRSVTPV